jgi:hypothetical protein
LHRSRHTPTNRKRRVTGRRRARIVCLATVAGCLLAGCGASHDAEESLSAYIRSHAGELVHKTAEQLSDVREKYGESGTELLCLIDQHSRYDETTGEDKLPTESEVESYVAETALTHSLTKEGVDDIVQTLNDASREEVAKAMLDAGCTGQFLNGASQ